MRIQAKAARARRLGLRGIALLAGCMAGATSHARDGNVFTPYLSLSYTMDDNLFRLPADVDAAQVTGRSQRGDLIRSLQAGVRGERYIGRQRLSFDISANQNRYRTYAYLDADLVNGSATWAWQLGHDLSGEIGTERVQSLTGFSEVRSTARNISTTQISRATANYALAPSWRLVGGVYDTRQRNSSVERTGGNSETEAVDGGLSYTPPSGNRLTVRARNTRASYPNRQIFLGTSVSNDFTQDDLEAEIYWQVSGQSRFSGLFAKTSRHYPDLPQRDYNGPTGRANWEWQATGKTSFNLGLKREIGAYQDFTTNYIVTDGVSLTAVRQVTAKTQIQGRLEAKTRRFLGDPGIVLNNTERRIDRVNSAGLTLSYQLAWPLVLNATLQNEKRTSNTTGFGYQDTSATLSVQLQW